jgi:hypothetical protein
MFTNRVSHYFTKNSSNKKAARAVVAAAQVPAGFCSLPVSFGQTVSLQNDLYRQAFEAAVEEVKRRKVFQNRIRAYLN